MTQVSRRTDAELVAASQLQEVSAFSQLVERYHRVVCAVAFATITDKSLSEDVAQDTFLALWRNAGKVHDPEKIRSWLCNTARNKAKNVLRKNWRVDVTTSPVETANDQSPLKDLEASEEAKQVRHALAELSELYREPLVLFYREELPVAELAAILDVTEATAKQRLSRGRKELRKTLEPILRRNLRKTAPAAGLIALIISRAAAEAGVGAAVNGVTSTLSKSALVKPAGKRVGTGLVLSIFGALIALSITLIVFLGGPTSSSSQSQSSSPPSQVEVAQKTRVPTTTQVIGAMGDSQDGVYMEGQAINEDELPVAGAWVTFTAFDGNSYTTRSGEDGTFVFENALRGDGRIQASEGHLASDDLQLTVAELTGPVILVLRDAVTLEIMVKTVGDQPVEGAVVTIGESLRFSTNERGIATAHGVQGGAIPFVVSAVGFTSVRVDGLLPYGTGVHQLTVVLPAGIGVSGTARTMDGEPLANAEIRAYPSSGLGRSYASRTDNTGRFAFPALPLDSYTLSPDSRLWSGRLEVILDSEPVHNLSLVLGPANPYFPVGEATVAGMVVDEDGEAVIGAPVRISRIGRHATTDHLGHFKIVGVPEGSHRLAVKRNTTSRAFGSSDLSVDVTTDEEVRLVLPSTGRVRAQLVSPDGLEIKQAWATLSPYQGSPMFMDGAIGLRNGIADFRSILPGTYVVSFYGDNFVKVTQANVEVRSGETTNLGDLTITAGKAISGTVTDARGEALRGIYVEANPTGDVSVFREHVGAMRDGHHAAITDAMGGFTLSGLGSQPLKVIAQSDRYGRSPVTDLISGVHLVIERPWTIHGSVVARSPLTGSINLRNISKMVTSGSISQGDFQVEAPPPGKYQLWMTVFEGESRLERMIAEINVGDQNESPYNMLLETTNNELVIPIDDQHKPFFIVYAGDTAPNVPSAWNRVGAEVIIWKVSQADKSLTIRDLQDGVYTVCTERGICGVVELRGGRTQVVFD